MSFIHSSLAWKASHLAAERAEERVFRSVLSGAPVTQSEREQASALRADAQQKLRVMLAACTAEAQRLSFPL